MIPWAIYRGLPYNSDIASSICFKVPVVSLDPFETRFHGSFLTQHFSAGFFFVGTTCNRSATTGSVDARDNRALSFVLLPLVMTAPLPWLEPHDPFPHPSQAWGAHDPAPGLLAAGGALDTQHLLSAYAQGIFPWFSQGQPILWWSPAPRMVLVPQEFRLHHALRKTLRQFRAAPGAEIRIDHDFSAVIRACAHTPRPGQDGTWIVPRIVQAYEELHANGYAHSVETWRDGRLVGGLYCVALGQAVFGESMFTHAADGSKIALAALVCLCLRHDVPWIDCQQNTAHLAFLGGRQIARDTFLQGIARSSQAPALDWKFSPLYWDALLQRPCPSPDSAPPSLA